MSAKLYVDTHAHIYPNYDVALLLDSASANFQKYSQNISEKYFVLALTERFDCNFFKEQQQTNGSIGQWKLSYDSNADLILAANRNAKIYILPGRQNISSEKLEILTLGSDNFRAENLPAFEIIKGSQETELITILPWSFGKWMGKRGVLVNKLIDDSSLDFSLGDPAHRFGMKSSLFSEGEKRNRTVLCGTDPLPLAGEEKRAGSYGSIFDYEGGELNSKSIVKAMMGASLNFGHTVGIFSGLNLQVQLRCARLKPLVGAAAAR